jgi:hypothetical protein
MKRQALSLTFNHLSNSYQQEIPSRFKKDFLKAAALNDCVAMDGMTRVLSNIGVHMKNDDMKVIFEELGNEKKEIEVKKLFNLI